jgi:GlpG protein
MRLIGTLEDEHKALTFSHFLQRKGIAHQIEVQRDTNWESSSYGTNQCQIWIQEEDQFEEALKWFHLFIDRPQDPIFVSLSPSVPFLKKNEQSLSSLPSSSVPPPPPRSTTTSWDQQPMGWMTRFLLGICCVLFFLSQIWTPSISMPERYSGLILFSSPVEKTLLFDYPKFYELIARFLHLYGHEELEHPSDLPPEGQHLLQKINQTPYWPGIYQLLLKGGFQAVKNGFSQYPTFEKIREGQIWRLFTPCLLHGDLLHLFFNMLWLIVLGKQIEQRLTPLRYGIFILSIGVISNTAQYLVSGPNFIGFSGILCGMLAFIWMRQKGAAWEGYQIDRLTLIFMLIFIIGMALIQLTSFVLEKSFEVAFSPNIANMAHLTGGVTGFLFGRLNFFRWRHV